MGPGSPTIQAAHAPLIIAVGDPLAPAPARRCKRIRELVAASCQWACLALMTIVFVHHVMVATVQWWTYHMENEALLSKVLRPFDARVAESHARARAYYEEQRPHFREAAKRFHLHQHFVETARNFTHLDTTYYDLSEKRLRAMAQLLHSDGRDDFLIEKSKCVMSSFFQRNGLPMVPILRNWTNQQQFIADLASGAAVANVNQWPIFIKFCHLTQGSARSVRAVPSAKYLRENIDELQLWINEKWSMRANDWTRPWSDSSNALTDVALPGAFLQAPARSSHNARTGKSYFIETKVEVLWGKAYLAIVYPEGLDRVEPLVTRPNGSWHAEVFDGYPDVLAARSLPMPADAWYQWIFDEGHMDCAWRLAERAATLMGADQVRLDIFLARGHPTECSLNENSISSGHPYGAHGEYLAKLWYEPHAQKWYKPYDNHLRIYEQTAANLPWLAAERAEYLQHSSASRHANKGDGRSSRAHPHANGNVRTRVSAHDDTVSVKQLFPKSAVGDGSEVTVVTTVTHSKGGQTTHSQKVG